MQVRAANVPFDTKHPVVRSLVVVAGLQTAQPAKDAGIVTVERLAHEANVGIAEFSTEEAANIVAGPVGRRDDRAGGLDWRLGRHDRDDALRSELVANAGIAGPAIDIVAITIIDSNEPEPAGVSDLPGDTQRILTVGPDAARRCRLGQRNRDHAEKGAVQAVDAGGYIAGKLVENANRSKRLQNEVSGC